MKSIGAEILQGHATFDMMCCRLHIIINDILGSIEQITMKPFQHFSTNAISI